MGWTWLEEVNLSEEEMERRTPEIEGVAGQLAGLRQAREQRGFERQARIEDVGYDDSGPAFDEDAEDEQEAHETRRRERAEEEADEERELEERLAALGARLMRPYEHWNEEEGLMEYLERDRG